MGDFSGSVILVATLCRTPDSNLSLAGYNCDVSPLTATYGWSGTGRFLWRIFG